MRTVLTALVTVAAIAATPQLARAQDPAAPAAPAPAPAPAVDNSIRPGMSEADVTARWGEPVAVRRANNWTYMYFRNYNEHHVGFYDTVFLQGGQVVDCIARGEGHTYMGQSSSPASRSPEFTPPARPTP